jgi:hypothetical protein
MDDETRRVVELEGEIAQTRVELNGTIEAIHDRLTPTAIAASATDRVRRSAFIEMIRANVLPLTAVGTGVGAAWLASRLDG